MGTEKKNIILEEFKHKYLIENLTLPECAKHFDCGITTLIRFCKKNNITKPKNLKYKNISKSHIQHDHDLIKKMYFVDNLTKQQIAEKLNIKKGAISKIISKDERTKTKEQINKIQTKLKVSREELFDLYINQNKPLEELCKYYSIGHTALKGALNRFNINKPQYKQQEVKAKKRAASKNVEYTSGLIDNETWLKNKYLNENLRIKDIAKISNSSNYLVRKFLKKFDLKKNTEQRGKFFQKVDSNVKDKTWLYNEYITKNTPISEIAEKENIGLWTVTHYIKKYGIEKPAELRSVLRRKKQIENGSIININGLSSHDIADKYDLSHSFVCAQIKKHNINNEEQVCNHFNSLKQQGMSSLELQFSKSLNLDFFNKEVETVNFKYKPDFKLTDNIYINVDGLYWHSDQTVSNDYHFKMRKAYEDNGLRILQFREDEVNNKLPIVESMINNLLNKNNKIYARNTEIRSVQQKDADNFLNDNHIMGQYKAKHIGLYNDNILVMILSYKNYKKGILKIERLCSKTNNTVIGGFSKLLKYLEQNETFKEVHYWVDLRYGSGDFLYNHNFTLSHETLGWKWTDFVNTYNRLKCRANMDNRKLTEKEHAYELGFNRIYDAGQRLYVRSYV